VITRVFNPERERTFRALDLEIVSPTLLGAEQVYSRFIMGENKPHLYLTENDFEMFEHLYEPMGKTEKVQDIEINHEIRVVALIRNNQVYIPTETDILKKGDRIVTISMTSSLHKAEKTYGRRQEE